MAIPLLDRYLWRHVRDIFLFGVAVFTVLLLVNHLFLLARLVLQQGAPLVVALQLLVYRMPYFLVFSFPMAMLLASLLTVGRLSDAQEITAMRTGGVSLGRITLSIVVAGVLVFLITLNMNEWVVPAAEDRYREALTRLSEEPRRPVQDEVLFRETQEGVESVFFARRFYADRGIMEGVVVNQFERGRLQRVIEAPQARYLEGQWVFERGTLYLFTGRTTVATQFDRLVVALARTPREIALPQREPSEMSIRELRSTILVLRRSRQNTYRYAVEIQSKFAVPASAALFALLAVPLGLRPHRGGTSIGFGLTIVVLVAYYILLSLTLTLGQGGRLPPVLAAWLPDVMLAALGVALLWMADR